MHPDRDLLRTLLGQLTLAASLLAAACASSGCFGDNSSAPPGLDAGLDAHLPTVDSGSPPLDAGTDSTTSSDDGGAGDASAEGATGTDASPEAAADADASPGPGLYVDPVNGVDTNDGSNAHPFKTVLKASQTVAAGQNIYLFAGTYDSSNQPTLTVTFPQDTWLRAMAPGTVTFKYSGDGMTFDGGGIQDVALQDFGNGAAGVGFAIHVNGGNFATTGVSFSNVGCPLATPGSSNATVVIDMTGVATPVSNVPDSINCAFVWADGTSNVTWKGGGTVNRTWTITPGGSAIFARGGATVTIDGVTIQHYLQSALIVNDNAHVTLKNVTIDDSGFGSAVYAIMVGGGNTQMPATPSLVLDTTSVTASHSNAISLSLYGTTAETPSLTFTNSHIDNSVLDATGCFCGGDGILVQGAPTNPALTVTITATNTTFSGNAGYAILSPRATVSLTGGDMSNNKSGGLQLTDTASNNSIKVRSTTFNANGGDFISLAGSASSSLDLGKKGDPGGIVFSGVPAGHSAVNLSAAVTGYAVGNTWMAGQLGADGTGSYGTPTTLSAGAAGLNATVGTGASLVVAQ
jgi:hypothetical protein